MPISNNHDGPFNLASLDIREFESLFQQHYQWLCLLCFKITRNWNEAEDLVQDFFARSWQKRDSIVIKESWKAFAARSVRNAALNQLQKENIRHKHENAAQYTTEAHQENAGPDTEEELRYLKLINAINQLPEQRRKVFLLSRRPDLRYTDIASLLGISVNTVKMHIRLSYQELRKVLESALIFFYFFIK
ncbi:RNA polymerase sigma-70 factor [Pseudobacter ginsenosidimutans]|uniref:RNA polymerase sigma-70 factor (ECF subfamily) n=1 Tax=Pseudobacter ginsenosidimutans TaxID=661488 RepID=A0A4Q7N4J3_9BACT|nr:RNA polymerase sigma-70 factor [Pseudobacter ginsenosidimutans]QEC44461.1 RNA polymerase sigma-70 factor [Pseudobacter ginsenosidimutans]RZS75933.1 RNA polymerase sigma-70 factor (ECF subfamily) [Pseudobacter ginsenosidimutans]